MMDVNDIQIRHSGGASNSDQESSIGGISSSSPILSQTFTAATIAGVTIVEVGGMEEGNALLVLDNVYKAFSLVPPEGAKGPEVGYEGLGNRSYRLTGSSGINKGYMIIDVVEANLPTVYSTDQITIATTQEGLFPNIEMTEATLGITQYRCVYLVNTHGTDTVADIGVYLLSDTEGEDSIEYAIDTDAGVNGTAVTLVDETDPTNLLINLTFESELDHTDAQQLGSSLAAGDEIAVWIKRTVPEYVSTEVLNNSFVLGIKSYLGG